MGTSYYTYRDPHADAKQHDREQRIRGYGLKLKHRRRTVEELDALVAEQGGFRCSFSAGGGRWVDADEWALAKGHGYADRYA